MQTAKNVAIFTASLP